MSISERFASLKGDGLTFNTWLIIAGVVWSALAVVAIIVFSFNVDTDHARVLAIALALAGASGALGGLAGFLFGIPKALQSESVNAGESKFVSNSNLEQISDWLTKILVGVGLVQIGSLPGTLGSLGRILAPSLGGGGSATFAVGLILYCLIIGFLLVYMWTRTRFLQILEKNALERKRVEFESAVLQHVISLTGRQVASSDRSATGQAED